MNCDKKKKSFELVTRSQRKFKIATRSFETRKACMTIICRSYHFYFQAKYDVTNFKCISNIHCSFISQSLPCDLPSDFQKVYYLKLRVFRLGKVVINIYFNNILYQALTLILTIYGQHLLMGDLLFFLKYYLLRSKYQLQWRTTVIISQPKIFMKTTLEGSFWEIGWVFLEYIF